MGVPNGMFFDDSFEETISDEDDNEEEIEDAEV